MAIYKLLHKNLNYLLDKCDQTPSTLNGENGINKG